MFSAVKAADSDVSTEVAPTHSRKILSVTSTAICKLPEDATKSAALICVPLFMHATFNTP